MSVLFWLLLAVGSAVLMMAASRFAITNSVAVAETLRVSPFIIGITLVAIGTDTPEIINSIISSYLGKGDINVGDSIGSVFTQGSLILGLFPFVTSITILVERKEVLLTSAITIFALFFGISIMSDSEISRVDGLLLVVFWVLSSFVLWYFQVSASEPVSELRSATRNIITHVLLALGAFGIVGIAASGLIRSIIMLSSQFGIPEYILSFFGASIGTSLPELAVEFTALKRNQRQMALGDVFGSCLVDATLSIGIGPLLFPTLVSENLVLKGSILAVIVILIAGLLLSFRKQHDKISGVALISLYLVGYFILK